MISEAEHNAIRDFANGPNYFVRSRKTMEAIYQRELNESAAAPVGHSRPVLYCIALKFLSEVFAPVPDLYLRSTYRIRVARGEGHLP